MDEVTDGEGQPTTSRIKMPTKGIDPKISLLIRILVGVLCVVATTVVVYLERDGYSDDDGGPVTWLDAAYYSTVTLSTTGYGDITPTSPTARLTNILVITPLRFLFLIVLIGTTIEVLTQEARLQRRINRWRKRVKGHTVVLGYGVKGRNAVRTLLNSGQDPRSIVVVAMDRFAVADALKAGVVGVVGDGRSEEILRDAGVPEATSVVVAPDQDDNAIMMTLAARRLNSSAHIVAAARESAAADMLRQSGANAVITTSEAAGNLMGLSLNAPHAGLLVEDLLDVGRGLEIVERDVTREERGRSTSMVNERGELVLAVLRGDTVTRFDESGNEILGPGDRLVVIRPAKE